ncbi:MAG: hypothetical protein QM708_03265 [Propioniciclava sp.]|uniref:hypothetical protein n=1 Tax=Propioniciclava sp. TaxID=2038686 RepID=UPI0039E6798D
MSRTGRGHGRITHGVHLRGTRIGDDAVTLLEGCRTTSLPRTVVDLARTLPFDWAVAVADAALARQLSRAALDEQLELSHGWPGNVKARSAIAFADPRSESPGESRSRAIFAMGGLPAPVLQFNVRANGILLGRSDFAWEAARLLGEFDGKSKYGEHARPGESPSDVLFREKAREERFREQGWSVVRWVWSDLNDPDALCARVSQALTNGRRRVAWRN